jgi:hypothetical protein
MNGTKVLFFQRLRQQLSLTLTMWTPWTSLFGLLLFVILVDAHHGQIDFAARNLNTISRIYNSTVYPHNVPIIQGGAAAVPPGLFNQNATGRISVRQLIFL